MSEDRVQVKFNPPENSLVWLAFLYHIAKERECHAWLYEQTIPCHAEECGCLHEFNSFVKEINEVRKQ